MVSNRSMSCLNGSCFLLLVAVFALVTCFTGTGGSSVPTLEGEVGQNVTFNCSSTNPQEPHFFYFQRGDDVVYGFYMKKIPKKWSNAAVEKHQMHFLVHLLNLNVSHNGNYSCIFGYGHEDVKITGMQLVVRANYTKPTVSFLYKTRDSWMVTCSSFGGYPKTTMRWNVPQNSTWKVVNTSSDLDDKGTKLFNSSSTAFFNCSSGERKLLSCSVGEVTSDMFDVCTRDPPDTSSPNHTAIIGVSMCFIFVMASGSMVLYRKNKRNQAREPSAQEAEEGEALNEK